MVNAPYWSLAIEVQFYGVYYFAIALNKNKDRFLLAISVIGAITSFFEPAYNTGLFFPYWAMFAIGIGLRRVLLVDITPARQLGGRYIIIATAGIIGWTTVFAVCVVCGKIDAALKQSLPATDIAFAAAFALLLWLSAVFEPIVPKLLIHGNKLLRGLVRTALAVGTASYSLYLLHGKIYRIPALFVRQIAPTVGSIMAMVLTMALTMGLAYIFYLVIERRFMSRRLVRAQDQVVLPELAISS